MTGLETLTWVLQGLVPLALIAATMRPQATRLSRALELAIAALYLLVIAQAGLWLALPRELILVYAALLFGGAAYRMSGRRFQAAGVGWRVPAAARGAVLAVLLGFLFTTFVGRRLPEGDVMDLRFPLSNGTYLIAAGGSNGLLNPHRKTASGERYRPWWGQSHGIDLVKVGRWGSRESSLSPDDPNGFEIFGDEVTAPCAGSVVAVVDGQPDMPTPGRPAVLEGNHVIIECGDVWVVLAHLQRGSVLLSPGARVQEGDPLGRVGNSGQSDEPHLHIHTQEPGTTVAPLGGEPIPIVFDGRYLVRNDRVHAPSPSSSVSHRF